MKYVTGIAKKDVDDVSEEILEIGEDSDLDVNDRMSVEFSFLKFSGR